MNNLKILKYETFLNDQLKPDLNLILEERDKLFTESAEYLALKNSILAIKASELKKGEPLKTQTDLGCNFYVQAEVPDPSRILVEVGLGFYVELTLDEALKLIEKKRNLIEEKTKKLTEDSCKVKANIKLTLEGLRQLQNIAVETEKDRRAKRVDVNL